MGTAYAELRRRTQLRISAGEIFWGAAGLPKSDNTAGPT